MGSAETVGLMGYGRFGAAFAGLCQEASVPVRALDVARAVPDEFRASSLPALVSGSTLLVVGVPLDQMKATFAELAPLVRPDQLVIDVGSVKVEPTAAMEAAFGARVQWLGTHPLFGPASLAHGERPLGVIVCPNPRHPQAVDRVEAFFRQLGCTPMRQSAEAHDQEMALTHALTFFVAKGMLDSGVPVDSKHAPPSFAGMARSIESVQVDAGHLFAALHRRNPYAQTARARLLEALAATHLRLCEPEPAAPRQEAALAIPDLGAHSPELREARELIDELDQELLSLLARRAELARRAARAKAQRGFGIADPTREVRLLAQRRQRATDLGLDADTVDEIFQAILRFSRALQR